MQQTLAANEQTVQWHAAKRRKTIEKLDEVWQKELAQALALLFLQHSLSCDKQTGHRHPPRIAVSLRTVQHWQPSLE